MNLIKVNQEKCILCGLCVNICPEHVLILGEHGPEAVSPEGCIACGHCVAVCPREAIGNTKTPLSGQTGAVMVGYPKYTYARLVDRNPLEVTFIDQ